MILVELALKKTKQKKKTLKNTLNMLYTWAELVRKKIPRMQNQTKVEGKQRKEQIGWQTQKAVNF